MPESQSQTPIQTQIRIRKPVKEALVLRIEKATYNTVRSFVESSSKHDYIWNTGIKLGDKVVFTKPDRWTLEVYSDRVVLVGRRGIEIELDQNQLRIGNLKFDLQKLKEDPIEALSTFIIADVPRNRPISLYEILMKVREYVEI